MATRGKMGDGDRLFAEGFKTARSARGMTHPQVVDAMNELGFNFAQQTVYKIENGLRRVTIGEAIALADVIGVPLEKLLPREDNLRELQIVRDLRAAEVMRAQHAMQSAEREYEAALARAAAADASYSEARSVTSQLEDVRRARQRAERKGNGTLAAKLQIAEEDLTDRLRDGD
ncbi:MAG: hypothetical protein DI566_04195 [Microbacterium sp.]|nr:MAG: hypothetical protein DI566_04195 [Microbacterium sp.]